MTGMKHMHRLVMFSLIAFAFFGVPEIKGQTSTGSVSGDVSDQTGAAIPGVTVTLESIATGEKRVTLSNETGNFNFPLIIPGVYRLTATLSGFSTTVIDDITVRVNQVSIVRVVMKVGEITEQVTVTAERVQVNATDPSIGAIVDKKEATTLPILGRSFLKLATLSAGAVAGYPGSWPGTFSGGRENMSVSISGAKDVSTTYLIDGSPTKSPEYGNIGYVLPLEMVEEFNIQRGFFSAKYPGPGVVNVASRSGSNEFHGSAWHTIRNDIFNARNFFDLQRKPPLRQNQFGASAGSPIVKDKLFWFGNFQIVRERRSSTLRGTVPTALELGGDFSRSPVTIRDPFTKQPFPGNRIPPERIHPFAKKYQEFIPQPTIPDVPFGAINRIIEGRLIDDDFKFDVRVDYIRSDKDRFFVRWGFGDSDKIFPSIHSYTTAAPYGNRNAVISYTHIFSPSLINEFHFGYDRVNNRPVQPWGPGVGKRDFGADLGLVNINQYQPCAGPPNVNLVSASFGTFLCVITLSNNYHYSNNLAYTRGRHTMNIGAQFTRLQITDPIFNAHPGSFLFTGQFSGSPVSDYLLGHPFQATALTKVTVPYRRTWQSAAYFEDTIRATSNLTFSFGLRWELPKPAYEKYDHISAFVPANESFEPNTPYKILLAGKDGVSREITKINYKDFSPRFGFAWQPFGNRKWAVRSSFGLFYETLVFNEYVFMSLGVPWVVPVQEISDPDVPTVKIDGQFGLPTLRFGGFQLSLDPFRDDPYLQQWTLSIERELPGSMLLSTAYVASKGIHLFKRLNYNVARPGTTPLVQRLPFPDFTGIIYDKAIASSEYNSLQVDLIKRYGHGLSFRMGYTWSRSMDHGEDQSLSYLPWNTRLDWGRSKFDIRHRFVISYIYDLPFGAGKRYLSSLPAVANKLISGWQIAGIGVAQTGTPLTVFSIDRSNTLAGLFGARPNRLCSGILPPSQRTHERWFDTSCFEVAPPNTYGNSGTRFFDSPGFHNLDISLLKNTRITEQVNLQFRAEFFNAFNRVNLGNPVTNISSPLRGGIFSAANSREIQFVWRLTW